MEDTDAEEGPEEEDVNNLGDSDRCSDRNQNAFAVSRTMEKIKHCWKGAFQFNCVPDKLQREQLEFCRLLVVLSSYLFLDHICSCFYLLLRSSCIWEIVYSKNKNPLADMEL
ncbi:hypothetical protein HispidOSU_007468 [Sigmodon hispidus]